MFRINKCLAAITLCCILLQNTTMGHPARCRPSFLRGIVFGAMAHVKELQNRYEWQSYHPKCRHVFRMKDHPECNLTGMERLPLSLHRTSEVIKVLGNMTLDSLVKNNLDTFSIIYTELSNCEATKSQQGEVCKRRLIRNMEKVSAECLQSDVLLNLIWTLIEDVGLVFPGDHHQGANKGNSPDPHKVQSSKKHKGKRKNKGKKNKTKAKPSKQQNI